MNRFMQSMFRKMAEMITSFWGIDDTQKEACKAYPDYPVSPFGPISLISKETIEAYVRHCSKRTSTY